jgi:hypothetical protein
MSVEAKLMYLLIQRSSFKLHFADQEEISFRALNKNTYSVKSVSGDKVNYERTLTNPK